MSTISYKRIILLGLPIVISGIIEPIVNTTDLILIGKFNKGLLGAVGLGSQVIMTIVWISLAFLTPVSARIGILFGQQKTTQIGILFNYLFKRSFLFGIILSLILFFSANHIIALFQADEFISKEATEFLKIRIIGLPIILIFGLSFQLFKGLQKTKIILVATVIGGLINLTLDLGLIPQFGIKGAAWASLLGQLGTMTICLWYLVKYELLSWADKLPNNIKSIFGNSFNFLIRTVSLNACLLIGNKIVAGNKLELTTHTVISNIFIIMAYFLDGNAHAGTVLVAQQIGEGKPKGVINIATKALVMNTGIISFFVLIGLTNTEFIFDQYNVADDSLLLFRSIILIYFITAFVGSIAFTMDGIYVGLERIKFLRNLLVFATIFGFIGYLAFVNGEHIQDVWTAFMIWMSIRAFVPLLNLLRTYKWY